jgi:hypothetical protein
MVGDSIGSGGERILKKQGWGERGFVPSLRDFVVNLARQPSIPSAEADSALGYYRWLPPGAEG